MLFAHKNDVVWGLSTGTKTYMSWIYSSGQGFCNIRIFEYTCCFCVH